MSLGAVMLCLCVQVRTLEGANRKLELQIREYYEKKTSPVSVDFTHYFSTINELRAQVPQMSVCSLCSSGKNSKSSCFAALFS